MLFQIFFHHKLMIIVFIDQSFLIYWHLNEGNFKSNYSPMERYLYLKIKSKHYFLECLNSNNVLLYCDCVFQFRIAGIFMYVGLLYFYVSDMLDCGYFYICQIAGIFRYVRPYDSESGWTICSPAAKCAGNNYRDSRGEARVWQITGKFVMTAKHYPARS